MLTLIDSIYRKFSMAGNQQQTYSETGILTSGNFITVTIICFTLCQYTVELCTKVTTINPSSAVGVGD